VIRGPWLRPPALSASSRPQTEARIAQNWAGVLMIGLPADVRLKLQQQSKCGHLPRSVPLEHKGLEIRDGPMPSSA